MRVKILVLLLCLVLAAAMRQRHVAGDLQSIHIAKGSSAHEIARQLYQAHFLWHPYTFLIWAKLGGAGALQPGTYLLSDRWTGFTLFRKLRQGPFRVRVTFPEGWTSRQMAALLEKHHVTSASEFQVEVDKRYAEGFLFPDTYFFEIGLTAADVVDGMTQRFQEKKPRDIQMRAQALKLTERQIVVLASLIEKEARSPDERALIGGVFYNRLRKHWRLESCATVQYALGTWKRQLSYDDLNVNSPYNTYRHYGLPPGPIGNPGAASLYAAAHPASTDMMFFVADGKGTHRFSHYYKEHLAVQQRRHPAP